MLTGFGGWSLDVAASAMDALARASVGLVALAISAADSVSRAAHSPTVAHAQVVLGDYFRVAVAFFVAFESQLVASIEREISGLAPVTVGVVAFGLVLCFAAIGLCTAYVARALSVGQSSYGH